MDATPRTRTTPPGADLPEDGRVRVVIERVTPGVPGADRFAVKRVVGESVRVGADIFADGHDTLAACVRVRRRGASTWTEAPLRPVGNDRWAGEFLVSAEGWHEFCVQAWVDRFGTWRRDMGKRLDAGQDPGIEFVVGAELVEHAAEHAGGRAGDELRAFAHRLRGKDHQDRVAAALDRRLEVLMETAAPRLFAAEQEGTVPLWVDRARAGCSAWYELFPRSASGDIARHGTFRDVEEHLPGIARMGFDVLYLPPIHPIGRINRKGPNNTLEPGPDDVGSPWAIGSDEGGHDSIHPALGSFKDFERLVRRALDHGIEIAMDLALQCAPDHPYVREHPEWFRRLPDGSIRYAENPPKKYQDIYPFDFECDDWRGLWDEILRVVLLWVDRGVRIFRVDNPHTKPFPLWEWLIARVRERDPGVLFLAEAFTRPRVMERLAKLGFTQSYTYFAWRTDSWGLREYYTELTRAPLVDYFRPNAWPNTPDILTEQLQHGGRPTFIARAVLAGTLSANWGVYGPAFELMEHRALRAGSEEYLDSEKYQLRDWDLERPDSLAPLLGAINRARRDNPALRQDRTLRFHACDNSAILCYSKTSGDNAVIVAVSTDTSRAQWGTLELDLASLGVDGSQAFQVHDALSGARYRWQGPRQVVGLDPAGTPAHIFRVRRREGSESGFEYFL